MYNPLKPPKTPFKHRNTNHNEKHAYAGQNECFHASKSPKWDSLTAAFWAQLASVAEFM
jgi:hypothetical protein